MSDPLENLKAGSAVAQGDVLEEIKSDLLPEFAILMQIEYDSPA